MPPTGQHQQQLSTQLAAETYDPDDVLPKESPLMKPLHPRLEISPSPPPEIHPAQVSPRSYLVDDCAKSNRIKIHSSSGDAVLVTYLDNGRHPEIARAAGLRSLPDGDDDINVAQRFSDTSFPEPKSRAPPPANTNVDLYSLSAMMRHPTPQQRPANHVHISPPNHDLLRIPRDGPDITLSTRNLSINDDQRSNGAYSLDSRGPSEPLVGIRRIEQPPTNLLTLASTGLPPIQMDTSRPEETGPVLPSIRSTLGDIDQIPSEPPTPAENDAPSLNTSGSAFTRSPPSVPSCLPRISTTTHASPPVSPNEALPRGLPSPRSIPATSPYSSFGPSPVHHRTATEYSSSADGQTPNTDLSAPTPATTASAVDRMSIDGITNPTGPVYICNFSGCTAPPFQTQYLLNSHANVHSSARPHYCPVQGCPRSEGGKGFKRKNEMIRHGLVHDSPGYVCPFCPDRDHKYPRPDNLQRHVRAHHIDKDKDDPLLREVLSQRPDGPNRGRRRRGTTN